MDDIHNIAITTEPYKPKHGMLMHGNYFIKVQSFGLEVRDVIAMERRFDIRY